MRARPRGLEQVRMDAELRHEPQKRQALDRIARARRRLQRRQRAHAVAGDPGPAHTRDAQHLQHPLRHGGDTRERGSFAAAVAGQVERQHAAAVMREGARLQRPDRVIHAGAVQEHRRRERHIEGLAADAELHGYSAAFASDFCAARSAWAKSSMMSSGSSTPTESRIMSSPTPAVLSCSALIC